MKKGAKIFCAALALVIVFGAVVGGTLAWLMDSETVTNVFTIGNIDITLTETGIDSENMKMYDLIPGEKALKDPNVVVESGSEACYLFVKLDAENSLTQYVDYQVRDGWTKLNGVDDVYYRTVDATGDDSTGPMYILAGDGAEFENGCVSIKNTIEASTIENGKEPKLVITAYAIQKNNITKKDGSAFTGEEVVDIATAIWNEYFVA